VQFTLTIKGTLPNPCHQLRVKVNNPDSQGRIVVDVYSVYNTEELCAEVIQEFEANIPLGSYPGKAYSIWVNDQKVADIQG
jgi:hypothetical protein